MTFAMAFVMTPQEHLSVLIFRLNHRLCKTSLTNDLSKGTMNVPFFGTISVDENNTRRIQTLAVLLLPLHGNVVFLIPLSIYLTYKFL
jgi:hypothetical protein